MPALQRAGVATVAIYSLFADSASHSSKHRGRLPLMPSHKRHSNLARRATQYARLLGIGVNYARERGLRLQREANPRGLICVGRAADDGRRVRLSARAAAAWFRMRDAAARDGITLLPLSGYRSRQRQAQNIRRKLNAGESLADILRLVAAPGYSEHHTGRAIDIGSPQDVGLDEKFGRTAAFRWLRRHAGRFGFHLSFPRGNRAGFGYEPWHWCWRSVSLPDRARARAR